MSNQRGGIPPIPPLPSPDAPRYRWITWFVAVLVSVAGFVTTCMSKQAARKQAPKAAPASDASASLRSFKTGAVVYATREEMCPGAGCAKPQSFQQVRRQPEGLETSSGSQNRKQTSDGKRLLYKPRASRVLVPTERGSLASTVGRRGRSTRGILSSFPTRVEREDSNLVSWFESKFPGRGHRYWCSACFTSMGRQAQITYRSMKCPTQKSHSQWLSQSLPSSASSWPTNSPRWSWSPLTRLQVANSTPHRRIPTPRSDLFTLHKRGEV